MQPMFKLFLVVTVMAFTSCTHQDSTTTNHSKQNSTPPKGKMDNGGY